MMNLQLPVVLQDPENEERVAICFYVDSNRDAIESIPSVIQPFGPSDLLSLPSYSTGKYLSWRVKDVGGKGVTLREWLTGVDCAIENAPYTRQKDSNSPRLECLFWVLFRHQLPHLLSQCENQRLSFSLLYSFLEFLQHNKWLGRMLSLKEILPILVGALPCNYIRVKVQLRADQIGSGASLQTQLPLAKAIDIFEPFYLDLPSSIVYTAFDCATDCEKRILVNSHDPTVLSNKQLGDPEAYKSYCCPVHTFFVAAKTTTSPSSSSSTVVLPARFVCSPPT